MSFYSRWQPLLDEDRHTALVFGFFRHAPTSIGLDPWLGRVLGRPATANSLDVGCFWPMLPSVIPGWASTEPELVFDAQDQHGPLKIVIEVKPGFAMHTVEQISREVVDVATVSGARRIALVMIGADLGPPAGTADWPNQIATLVDAHRLDVETETHYSSFALTGQVITAAGQTNPDWAAYAADVNAQLNRKGLLGYGGAPMLDDLEGLTLANAVEGYNRITKAARQFYLQLHHHPAFQATGIAPDVGTGGYVSPRMQRDGRTDTITQPEDAFETTVFLSLYLHPDLPEGDRIFIAFDLLAHHTDAIQIIAGRWRNYRPADNLRRLATALAQRPDLQGEGASLPCRTTNGESEWTYDRREWQPARASEDIDWATERIAAALASSQS